MPKKTKILIAFGEVVREKRKERGLSQEDLAFKADLHRTYIGDAQWHSFIFNV